jgi:hypothetical protein
MPSHEVRAIPAPLMNPSLGSTASGEPDDCGGDCVTPALRC